MNTPFRIGLGPHREGGVVCHNEKCGSRDAVTNVCRLNVKVCGDRMESANDTKGQNDRNAKN